MQKTAEQNYAGLVTFYNTRLGNEVGLFYNASEPTRDTCWRSEECLLIGPWDFTAIRAYSACHKSLVYLAALWDAAAGNSAAVPASQQSAVDASSLV